MHNDVSAEMNCAESIFKNEKDSLQSAEELLWDEPWNDEGKRHPCAWIRKNEHRKRLKRKYQIMHHQGDSQGKSGMQLRNAIYLAYNDTDWRTHGYVNFHQHLYLSSRGDIRVYHGDIIAYPHVYTPIPSCSRKYHTVQANRRIRHMRLTEEGTVSYSWLKKKYTCFDDGL